MIRKTNNKKQFYFSTKPAAPIEYYVYLKFAEHLLSQYISSELTIIKYNILMRCKYCTRKDFSTRYKKKNMRD